MDDELYVSIHALRGEGDFAVLVKRVPNSGYSSLL